jgi:hypothetical protein
MPSQTKKNLGGTSTVASSRQPSKYHNISIIYVLRLLSLYRRLLKLTDTKEKNEKNRLNQIFMDMKVSMCAVSILFHNIMK